MDQFFLNPPIPHDDAQKLFAVQFLKGVGIKPE